MSHPDLNWKGIIGCLLINMSEETSSQSSLEKNEMMSLKSNRDIHNLPTTSLQKIFFRKFLPRHLYTLEAHIIRH
jgi:hypothetical protein